MIQISSPWLNGVAKAALYASMDKNEMRRLVKSGVIVSRKHPKREDGTRPRGVLVWAPSIDKLIMEQPSGACEVAARLADSLPSCSSSHS
jgi:hypothetical protein